MEVSTTKYQNCDLVSVTGKIDHSTAASFDDALEAITKSRRYNIVIDMSGVEYMSSAGLRVLARIQTTCKEHHGDVVLAMVPQLIYEALELVAFTKFFKFYDNVVDAVGSF
jgi:anti-sigma B factor antagonist